LDAQIVKSEAKRIWKCLINQASLSIKMALITLFYFCNQSFKLNHVSKI